MSEGIVAQLERLQADCERLYGSAPLLPIAVAADARDEILRLREENERAVSIMTALVRKIDVECRQNPTPLLELGQARAFIARAPAETE